MKQDEHFCHGRFSSTGVSREDLSVIQYHNGGNSDSLGEFSSCNSTFTKEKIAVLPKQKRLDAAPTDHKLWMKAQTGITNPQLNCGFAQNML
jgi:hypothetical protein